MRVQLSIILLLLFGAACGTNNISSLTSKKSTNGTDLGEEEGASEETLENFQLTVYPLFREFGCNTCHSPGAPAGSRMTPYFANYAGADAASDSYDALTSARKVNLQTPAESRVYLRFGERHNCGSNTQCDSRGAQLLSAIQEWKRLEGTVDSAFDGTKSLAVTIPPTTNSATPTTMRVPVRDWNAALIPTGTEFVVDVQLDAGGNNYIFKNPRFLLASATPQRALSFASWALFLNDTTDFTTNSAVPYSALTQGFVTDGGTVRLAFRGGLLGDVTVPKGTLGTDTLKVGIRTIVQQDPNQIRLIAFQDVLQSSGCNGCHSNPIDITRLVAGVPTVVRTVPAFGNTAVYQRAQDFINGGLISPRNPDGSWLYRVVVVTRTVDGALVPNTEDYTPMPYNSPTGIGTSTTDPNDKLYIIRDFINNL